MIAISQQNARTERRTEIHKISCFFACNRFSLLTKIVTESNRFCFVFSVAKNSIINRKPINRFLFCMHFNRKKRKSVLISVLAMRCYLCWLTMVLWWCMQSNLQCQNCWQVLRCWFLTIHSNWVPRVVLWLWSVRIGLICYVRTISVLILLCFRTEI